MAIGGAQAGIPLFLMAIMVGNGANAGALSPFAPTGIIVNGVMTQDRPAAATNGRTYGNNLMAHVVVAFGGLLPVRRLEAVHHQALGRPGGDVGRDRALRQPGTGSRWGSSAAVVLGVIFFDVHVGMAALDRRHRPLAA